MPYDDYKKSQPEEEKIKKIFRSYDRIGGIDFSRNLTKLPFGEKIKVKNFMKNKFAGGIELSHSQILKEIKEKFGPQTEKKVKDSLTKIKKGLTEGQKERNIKALRREILMEEDEDLANELIKGRAEKSDRGGRAKQRIDDKVNELFGKPKELEKKSNKKGSSIGLGEKNEKLCSDEPPASPKVRL
ncbi:hypothetical protein CO115_01540 [Candidatus Falkowbacteria bacterium CG_4_9_14_3_um_filter_36_9]|uniref:Uncharacterized protein n=2 Tax=Candidatus Falkowiibacteriota TaxID=1752728 RepID=A0A1J4TBI7_9BACT|nr:MAG: hypothetical protein AUJ27_00995 [Candidatus Falkowbacteria bacterium CG1_02_37_44]PIV51886.1 MAG: hypothetical protein COS18_01775 [Candidatus Falkowbacteria bacterium CG02_land_8_20_14_3_00_36_14]PIX12087.1 MAG: hypothetical protein COZ73_01170 [Candidatus Falkowbacteria bacterium CG_4_8_14_3_um_filter_36_11]PJA10861.1 MAG: hypothetical protein COX67_02950 [Candidatus Falkowbacteria bacterium CG_4_10_14_0_2_um_filter_36_22]PJB20204.1 MAG: hypothetical protein CO115_01540 [Candidatus F